LEPGVAQDRKLDLGNELLNLPMGLLEPWGVSKIWHINWHPSVD